MRRGAVWAHNLTKNIETALGRSNLSAMEEEFYDLSSFAVNDADMEGLSLLETVKKVKPNILIGE